MYSSLYHFIMDKKVGVIGGGGVGWGGGGRGGTLSGDFYKFTSDTSKLKQIHLSPVDWSHI